MEHTQPVDWIGKPSIGYMVNATFSNSNAGLIGNLIDDIKFEFGEAIFCAPLDSLHMTLIDWIAPLIDYNGQDKTLLFEQLQTSYDQALTDVLSNVAPIQIVFNEICLSPTTIFIKGKDDGRYNNIRKEFLRRAELISGTKQPPTIVHSSLGRFIKPLEMDVVQNFLAEKTIEITQTTESFRLVRATREPMLEYGVLKEYELR